MPQKFQVPPGTVIGPYRVRTELGRGAMAAVYLAEDPVNGARVAVKILRPELGLVLGPERFAREIEILGRLHHRSIVPVLGAGQVGSLLYYLMPYVEGENLRSRLQRSGPFPLAGVLTVARELAAAIDYAHSRNVIHRDIKPENILLDLEGAHICDFGLARAMDAAALEPLSSSGMVVGTPAYMSPEQAVGEEVGPSCDVYALGCVMYELLTGELPFTGATRQALLARQLGERPRSLRGTREDVPAALERGVMRALAREPGARPKTAAQVLEGF
jgi:eukaryotic-like serine/threonine-protein kinase